MNFGHDGTISDCCVHVDPFCCTLFKVNVSFS